MIKHLKVLTLALAVLTMPLFVSAAENDSLGIDVSIDYESVYFCDGANVFYDTQTNTQTGVIFPAVSWTPSFVPGALTIGLCGEIPECAISNRKDQYKKSTDNFIPSTGLDYTVSYGYDFFDGGLALAATWYYYQYPASYDKNDKTATWDSTGYKLFISSAKVPVLTPAFIFEQKYKIGAKNFKNFTMKFSLSHSFGLTEHIAFDLGSTIEYVYWGASSQKGFASLTIDGNFNLGLGKAYAFAGLHYGVALEKEFATANGQRQLYWANIGAGYSF